MSTPSKLPELPRGVTVFCSNRDLLNCELRLKNGKYPHPYSHELAEPKKGRSGIARLEKVIVQCVAFQGGWRMTRSSALELH